MGVVLFLAGDKRLASPEATFLLHPIKLVLPGSSLEVDAKALRRISARLEHSFNPSPARLRELDLTIARVEREDNSVQTIPRTAHQTDRLRHQSTDAVWRAGRCRVR
jgi:hypothetical protein